MQSNANSHFRWYRILRDTLTKVISSDVVCVRLLLPFRTLRRSHSLCFSYSLFHSLLSLCFVCTLTNRSRSFTCIDLIRFVCMQMNSPYFRLSFAFSTTEALCASFTFFLFGNFLQFFNFVLIYQFRGSQFQFFGRFILNIRQFI